MPAEISFEDFARAAGFELTPAQLEFARVAFDGQAPSDTELARTLWGENAVPARATARQVVGAVCGRGSGKTLLGGLQALRLAMTVDLSKLPRRERAEVPVVSPDLETAQQVVRVALGAAENLGLKISGKRRGGDEGFVITRKGGQRVLIVARSASIGGRSIRGRTLPAVVLDEAAFFYDKSHKVSDAEIFNAALPRVKLVKGAQIILLSSPWAESGLLYELYERNYGHPVDALIAHAPTSLMRSDEPGILEAIETERLVDPIRCQREYDAIFMSTMGGAFFDGRAVAGALSEGLTTLLQNATKAVGGDFAFRRNSSAFAAVQLADDTSSKKRLYSVLGLLELQPTEGRPLKPSEVCFEAAQFTKEKGGIDEIMADGHYREAVVEHLGAHGVVYTVSPEGQAGKAEVFQTARQLFHEGLVRLPKGDPLTEKLVRQLKEVTARPLSGGGLAIESPLWRTGEHGDLVSAFVIALWRAYKLGWEPPAEETVMDERSRPDEIEKRLMLEAAVEEERLGQLERALGVPLRGVRI